MKSKIYTQNKQPLDKTQSSKLCKLGVKRTSFQNLTENRKQFFLSMWHFKRQSWITETFGVSAVLFGLALLKMTAFPTLLLSLHKEASPPI